MPNPSIRPLLSPVLRIGAVAALAVGLAACSSVNPFKSEDPSGGQACPQVRIDRDTATFTKFRDGRGQDLTDVLFSAEIVDFAGDCGFDKKTGAVNVKMKVMFAITKGPAEQGASNSLSYFVALPAFFPAPAAKQTLPVEFKYPDGNVATMMVRDGEVTLTIPLKDRTTRDTPIYVGFQLTPEQLAYNRRQRR